MLASVEALYFLTTDVSRGFKGRWVLHTFAHPKVWILIDIDKFLC
jgi:hypothetical protein